MRLALILACVVLTSCAAVEEDLCTIPEFQVVMLPQYSGADYPAYKCIDLIEALTKISEVNRSIVTDRRFFFYDAKIRGVTISVIPENTWIRMDKKRIAGQTLCATNQIEINSAESLYRSSLAHELAHYVQRCEGSPEVPDGDHNDDPDHRNWIRDGIFRMIDEVHALDP